jgi:FkbM family methyltransferase
LTNVRLLEWLGSRSRRLPESRTKNRLGRLAAYALGNPHAARASIANVPMLMRPADRTASSAFWSGHYEDRVVALLAGMLEPGMTVLDVGANIGLIGLRLADRLRVLGGGRVVFVEPMPGNVDLLRRSIALNEYGVFCEVLPMAASESPGTTTLFAEGHGRSGNAIPFARRLSTPTVVVSGRLDDHVRGSVGLMKIDVEGAELAALRGAVNLIRESRPTIFGEFHVAYTAAHGHTFLDVMDFLAPFGYRAYRQVDGRLIEAPPQPKMGDVLLVAGPMDHGTEKGP